MIAQAELRNRILSRISPDDYALLVDKLELVEHRRDEVLAATDEKLPYVCFLEEGIASIIVRSPDGHQTEIGIIGREGFLHPSVVLGADSVPHELRAQVAGQAYRISTKDLIKATDATASLRRTLLLFAQIVAVQMSFTALSNAVHPVEQRLARWLLMVHDRSDSNELPLTHEFIGSVLAARRPTVTNSLHVLAGKGLIELERGFVTVRHRPALEKFAGKSYGKTEAEYRRLLGPF